MARSLSNAKLFSVFVVDGLTALNRRGYASVSQGLVSSLVRGGSVRSGVLAKKSEETFTERSPWVPDPVTGYYRPEEGSDDIDVAELREMLLKHKRN